MFENNNDNNYGYYQNTTYNNFHYDDYNDYDDYNKKELFLKERIFAKLVDIFLFYLIGYLLVIYYSFKIVPEIATSNIFKGLILIWIISSILVFFITPILFRGRTIGKIIFKIYYLKEDGGFLNFRDIFINYLFDIFWIFNITFLLTKNEFLSNKFNKTKVVKF